MTEKLGSKRILVYTKSINEALLQVMERDDNVFVLGQGINDHGGYWGITEGIERKFGENRCFDVPLSENGIIGTAIGASIGGMRAISFNNRPDFLYLAMDQIINHATKFNYMSGGQCNVPIVIWAAVGRGWGSGAQHTQSLQAFFMHIPGCKIVMPTTPYDAKGLMVSAILDNNPVIILEHRLLFNQTGNVPIEMYKIELGKGIIRKKGNDITIIGISYEILTALKVAEMLEKDGIFAEVIDLRTIKPWDKDLVINSVKKTRHLTIIDTAWRTGSISGEIAASIYESLFKLLKAPILRIGTLDIPTPASSSLEAEFYPNPYKICEQIRCCLGKN